MSADTQINADAQIHAQISAQSTSLMQRSVHVLSLTCVGVSVSVSVWVFVVSVGVCICVCVSAIVFCVSRQIQ